nr:MAG TPA: hypothetical protein [Caudoviricetes sp.]
MFYWSLCETKSSQAKNSHKEKCEKFFHDMVIRK